MPIEMSNGPRFRDRLQALRQLVPEGAVQEMSEIYIRSRPLAVLMMATVIEEEAFTWMGFWMYT